MLRRRLVTLFAVFIAVYMPFLAAAPLDPAPEGSFSIVVLPDTQVYLGAGTKEEPESTDPVSNPIFDAHITWILDNLNTQKIAFVSHVGDIIDKNVPAQWKVAQACMNRLHGKIPYGIAVGNHDMSSEGDSSLFQEYFPAERFKDCAWYAGCFPENPDRPHVSGNNANSYQLFSAGGLDFVYLHLECNAPDEVLRWADGIMDQYANRWAIVTTHMDLGPLERPEKGEGYFDDAKGRMKWVKIHGKRGNSPQQMWEKCFSQHQNLLMICSGDQRRSTAMYLPLAGVHGNIVHSLMSDYSPLSKKQSKDFRNSKVGDAAPKDAKEWDPLRVYRFLPKENAIQVITYDTTRNALVDETVNVPSHEAHQFTIHTNLAQPSAAKAVSN